MIKLSRDHIKIINTKKSIKEFFDRFCMIPMLITLIGIFLMIYFKYHNILLIPFIFLGSILTIFVLSFFVFDINDQKDLHDGDE